MPLCRNGHDNPEGQRFCGHCGAQITALEANESDETPSDDEVHTSDDVPAAQPSDPSAAEPPRPTTHRRLVLALIGGAAVVVIGTLVAVLLTRDEDALTPIAEGACEELEGAIVLQAGAIVGRAISQAEQEGYTAPELGDRMREKCPALMSAMENISEEQEAEDQLPSEMDLEITSCDAETVRGSVENNSSERVDIFIEITLESSSGTQVGDSLASVNGLEAGNRATWDAPVFESYDTCNARIGSVFIAD